MSPKDTVVKVNPSMLILNEKKQEIYQNKPTNYDEIKENIEEQGIITPLLVNKNTNVIIDGNVRLLIAMELGLKEVPVIYKELVEKEMDIKSVSSNQQRRKSYSEILKEIEFFEHHYKIKKGQRTDLDPELKKIKEKRDAALKGISRTTKEKVKAIASLAEGLYGKDSEACKGIFNSLDKDKTTLNGLYQHLFDLTQRKQNAKVIPLKYEVIKENTKIYNHSSEDMHEIEDGSIDAIITSPPYYKMKEYGNGENEIGQEGEIEEYLLSLSKIFKECYRVLRDDGSLFVNLNDCVLGGRYQAIPHYFVLQMLEQGWILNDELLWIKNNPTYTRGKRSVRSHEPIFHFVKSSDFYYNDAWIKDLTDKEDKISYGINKSSPKVKSGLDFREGVLTTNVSNTSDLRTKCKEEEGFYLTHSATFPIDVPAICGFLTTQEGGTILDPFSGTSTVGLFARSNNRKYIGYDLNPEFIKASEVRIGGHLLYLPTNTLISWIQLHSLKEKSETGIISEFQVLKSYLRPVPSKGRISFSDFTKTYNRCFQIAQKISYE